MDMKDICFFISMVVDGGEECSYKMEVVIRKSEIVIKKVDMKRKWLL
jgi:hypothetical protein